MRDGKSLPAALDRIYADGTTPLAGRVVEHLASSPDPLHPIARDCWTWRGREPIMLANAISGVAAWDGANSMSWLKLVSEAIRPDYDPEAHGNVLPDSPPVVAGIVLGLLTAPPHDVESMYRNDQEIVGLIVEILTYCSLRGWRELRNWSFSRDKAYCDRLSKTIKALVRRNTALVEQRKICIKLRNALTAIRETEKDQGRVPKFVDYVLDQFAYGWWESTSPFARIVAITEYGRRMQLIRA